MTHSKRDSIESVVVENLRLQFQTEPQPLLDVGRFEWQSGIPYVVMAASGWGKTSLFRAMSGWYRGQRDVMVDLTANYNLARDVEFIGNHQSLLPWLTIGGNAEIRSIESQRDRELFEKIGLPKDVASRWPYELSLGMYKRAELVCAMLRRPRLLILDEFFSSLDDDARTQCGIFLRSFSQSRILVISTHQIDLVPFREHKLVSLIRQPHTTTVTALT